MRIGEEVSRGYCKGELSEVFRRYLPKSELEAVKAEWSLAPEAKAEVADETQEAGVEAHE